MAREMGTDAKTMSYVKEFLRGFNKTQHAGFTDEHPDSAPTALEFEDKYQSRFSDMSPAASSARRGTVLSEAPHGERRGSVAGKVKIRPGIADPKPRRNIHNKPRQTISAKLKISGNVFTDEDVNKFHFFENEVANNAALIKERKQSITKGYRKGVGKKRNKLLRENYMRMMNEADDLLNAYNADLNEPMTTEAAGAEKQEHGVQSHQTSPRSGGGVRFRPSSAPGLAKKAPKTAASAVEPNVTNTNTKVSLSDEENEDYSDGSDEEEDEEIVLDPNYKPFGPITYEMKMENLMKEVLQTDFYNIEHSMEAEVMEIHTGFQRLDKNKDGFLTYDDLYGYCKEHYDLEFEQQLHQAIAYKQSSLDHVGGKASNGATSVSGNTGGMMPSKDALKELEEPLRELVWQLDDSRRNSLTFEDVRKYYIRYFEEKNEAEAMVIKNEVLVPHSSGRTVVEKRVADKFEDAYRNRHVAENPLLYHLLLFAYLEGGDALKYYQGPKSPAKGGSDDVVDSLETTKAELLLLPALHVSI